MCGRYGRFSAVEAYAAIIKAMVSPRFEDSAGYNRPPGTFQLIGLVNPDDGAVTLGPAWWGFVPNWATDTKLAPINARSETADEKKLFAKAFEQQRCLVAADYWIEWQRNGDNKQPYAIRPSAGEPFFFAGIWSKASRLPENHAAAGQVTFAILTGQPNDDIAHVHNRQPQALTAELSEILAREDDYESRLDMARRWQKEWHFRAGVHLLRGLSEPEEAGQHYADLAQASLAAILPVVEAEFARKHGQSVEEARQSQALHDELQAAVDAMNRRYARVENIRKFRVLDAPLSVETGELTPTLKVRRNVVISRNQALVDAMYAEGHDDI